MASLYKRGDNYYLAFHQSNQTPTRKHVSLRASSYKVAQHKAAQLIVRYEKGEYDPWRPAEQPKTQTLGAAVTVFIQTRRNLSKQSVAKYVIKNVTKWLAENRSEYKAELFKEGRYIGEDTL